LSEGIDIVEAGIRAALARDCAGPLVVGLCGPQASGKSTMVAGLRTRFEVDGIRTAILGLDDIYLSSEVREQLAANVHSLLRTRGVPGTHDVALGEAVLDGLGRSGETVMPRFDKARDNPHPRAEWRPVTGPMDVVLFEGWCVGAQPQTDAALIEPVNALERERDPDGTWRRYVNARLAGDYACLFARIGYLVLLAPPDFATVVEWRKQPEREFAAELARAPRPGARAMSDAEVEAFVAHYERLTCHILDEMPARADVVVRLDRHRRAI